MRKRIIALSTAAATGVAGFALTLGAVLPAGADTGTDGDATSFLEDRLARLKDALAGLVEDGTLTQDEADTVAETLNDSDVLGRGGPGAHDGFGIRGGVSLDVAAETLGLTTDELRTALQDGSTLAEIAAAQGVETADLVSALVTAATEHIDQAVSDGRLDQTRADELKADLETRITEAVESGMPLRDGGPGRRGGPGGMGERPDSSDGDSSTSEDGTTGGVGTETPSTTPSLQS